MPTPQEILELRRQRSVAPARQGSNVAADTPAAASEFTTPTDTEGGGGFGNAFGGFVSRLVSPLVDLPDLPGGIAGEVVERGVEELSSPLGIAMAALAPVTGGASLGLTGLGGTAARVGTRLGAEALTGGAASLVAGEVNDRLPEGTPGWARGGLALAAGLGAGVGTARLASGAVDALPGSVKATRAAQRTRDLIKQVEAPDPEMAELVGALSTAKSQLADPTVRRQLKEARSIERMRRLGRSAAAIDPTSSAADINKAFLSQQKGKLPGLDFPELTVSPETIENIEKRVLRGTYDSNAPLLPYESRDAYTAIQKVFAGEVPNNYEMGLLERALGPQVVESINDLRPTSLLRMANDLINLPRAVLASMDMSFGLRQGILAIGADPVGWVRGNVYGAKAFASPEYAKQIDDLVRGVSGSDADKAMLDVLKRWGVEFTGSSTTPEEAFQAGKLGKILFGSNEAGRVMAGSERSFVTVGNYLRYNAGMKTLKSMLKMYEKPGDTLEQTLSRIPYDQGKRLAETVNVITGRSGLKQLKGERGRTLNAFLFAPNYLASRFIAPTLLPRSVFSAIKTNPKLLANPVKMYADDPVMRLQAKALGGFVAQGMLGLASLKGAAQMGWIPDFDIETDPRKSTFGKGKFGDTEIDFWGGYAPIARTIARATMGTTVSRSGTERSISRPDVIWNEFVRSKVAPVPGFAWNAITGTNFIGDKVDYGVEGIEEQALDALVPLFIQDVMEAYNESGTLSALAIAPAPFFGLGINTFVSLGQVKDTVAQSLFSKPYEDLTGPERQVADLDPRIQEKLLERDKLEPYESFGAAMEAIGAERQAAEELIVGLAASGQITRQQMADALGEQTLIATAKRDEAVRQYQLPEPQTDSILQQGLSSWYDLYDLADWGAEQGIKTGRIDWTKFDQLERDLFATLTSDQIDFIENRKTSEHTPIAQWYFDNRKYITDSGYYDVADEQFERFRRMVNTVDPAIETYGQLQVALDATKFSDPAEYRRLNAVWRRIDKLVTSRREQMRKRNPDLDAALYSIGRTSTLLTPAARKLVTQ